MATPATHTSHPHNTPTHATHTETVSKYFAEEAEIDTELYYAEVAFMSLIDRLQVNLDTRHDIIKYTFRGITDI